MNIYCHPEYNTLVTGNIYNGFRYTLPNGIRRNLYKKYTRYASTAEEFDIIRQQHQQMIEEGDYMVGVEFKVAPSNRRKLDSWLKKLDGVLAHVKLEGIEF